MLLHKEPNTVQEVLNDEKFQPIKEKYDAFIKSDSWSLFPRLIDSKVVRNI